MINWKSTKSNIKKNCVDRFRNHLPAKTSLTFVDHWSTQRSTVNGAGMEHDYPHLDHRKKQREWEGDGEERPSPREVKRRMEKLAQKKKKIKQRGTCSRSRYAWSDFLSALDDPSCLLVHSNCSTISSHILSQHHHPRKSGTISTGICYRVGDLISSRTTSRTTTTTRSLRQV